MNFNSKETYLYPNVGRMCVCVCERRRVCSEAVTSCAGLFYLQLSPSVALVPNNFQEILLDSLFIVITVERHFRMLLII